MESLTDSLVKEAMTIIDEVEALGGMTKAIESGYVYHTVQYIIRLSCSYLVRFISPYTHVRIDDMFVVIMFYCCRMMIEV